MFFLFCLKILRPGVTQSNSKSVIQIFMKEIAATSKTFVKKDIEDLKNLLAAFQNISTFSTEAHLFGTKPLKIFSMKELHDKYSEVFICECRQT